MNRRGFTLALLAGLVAMPAVAQDAPAGPDPVAAVRRVYDPKVKVNQRGYSARLNRLLQAAQRKSRQLNEVVSGLDFDPTINAQDSDDNFRETLKYAVRSQGVDRAVVEARMRISKGAPEQTLVFELVLENKVWRIDDIVNPAQTDGWRWSKMLEAGARGE
ncbi:MAG: DUF3828 domain-containing protein [Beijerinckiaceae bacterium]|jgi:hypothetical protein|nr:DUF3828 domain-containing protein [Beijerinckiaceae bacterium]